MQPPETLYLDDSQPAVVILDQTLLPQTVNYTSLTNINQVWAAINELKVRGAPAIGVTAALGLYVHMKVVASENPSCAAFAHEFERAKAYLSTARPTAVNLDWALGQMAISFEAVKHKPIPEIVAALHQAAEAIKSQDTEICRRIGKHGANLLKEGMGILTH